MDDFDSPYYEDRRQDEEAFWALQSGDKKGFFTGVKRAAERELCLCPNYAVYAGQCYELGFGVEKNPTEAVRMYRKKADRFAPAMVALGFCYSNGVGVARDYAEALKRYRRAAEEGDRDAMYNLGAHYANGRGVKRDLQEAARWFEKSLEAGNKEAQAALESLATLEPVQETTLTEKLVGLFRRDEEAIKTIRPRGYLEEEME